MHRRIIHVCTHKHTQIYMDNGRLTLYLHTSSCSELGHLSVSSPSVFVYLRLPAVPSHVCQAGQTSAQSSPADGVCLQSENDVLRYLKELRVVNLRKKARMFLYRAVYSPSDRVTLHPVANYSFQQQLNFSGKYSATLQLLCKDYSMTFPPLYIARYLFIQLSELRQCGVNENAQLSKRQ